MSEYTINATRKFALICVKPDPPTSRPHVARPAPVRGNRPASADFRGQSAEPLPHYRRVMIHQDNNRKSNQQPTIGPNRPIHLNFGSCRNEDRTTTTTTQPRRPAHHPRQSHPAEVSEKSSHISAPAQELAPKLFPDSRRQDYHRKPLRPSIPLTTAPLLVLGPGPRRPTVSTRPSLLVPHALLVPPEPWA